MRHEQSLPAQLFGGDERYAQLAAIAALWMKLAVLVKRWHDRDKSGWWVLITFIPVIGSG